VKLKCEGCILGLKRLLAGITPSLTLGYKEENKLEEKNK